jgi:hypothetical protein
MLFYLYGVFFTSQKQLGIAITPMAYKQIYA